jgi:hypothetical protein
MAEMTLRLEIDPETGRKNLIISYQSDSDALPHEHEDEHRRLVDGLIEGGLVKARELGKVVVERAAGSSVLELEGESEGAEPLSEGQSGS